jgi:heme oxygenase
MCVDLVESFAEMDVGMLLWYAHLDKEKYVCLYQCKKSTVIYCSSKGCKCAFTSVDDWSAHFKCAFILPGVFSQAVLIDGKIKAHPTARLQLKKVHQTSTTHINEILKKHTWAWRTLGDAVNGKRMSQVIKHKLEVQEQKERKKNVISQPNHTFTQRHKRY